MIYFRIRMSLDCLIEGLLFYTGTAQKKQSIRALLAVSEAEFSDAISLLSKRLGETAVRLLETKDTIQLVTAPELSDVISTFAHQEHRAGIGKAGAETLAIILYREPITRAEIDTIRGVNSGAMLRNLLQRGLVERAVVKNTHEYRVTADLLKHLGVTSREQLPNFEAHSAAIMGALETQPETI